MKKIPENINKIISEFITAIKDTFGDRVKKIIKENHFVWIIC